MNIGYDNYLSREWDRVCEAHDEAERLHRIEEIRKEIAELEDELYELTYTGDE